MHVISHSKYQTVFFLFENCSAFFVQHYAVIPVTTASSQDKEDRISVEQGSADKGEPNAYVEKLYNGQESEGVQNCICWSGQAGK